MSIERTVYTNWTKATTSPNQAMVGLISCIESGRNAWIEVRENGNQDLPIMIKNPSLNNPFHWTMAYSVMRNEQEMKTHQYFNDTEKDLTYNWIAGFGSTKAIAAYQKDGTISEGLLLTNGICHPVRIKDANEYRRTITGDNYEYGAWVTYWKPINSIQLYVVDYDIDEVFTVCYDDQIPDRKTAIKRAAEFMLKYAESC